MTIDYPRFFQKKNKNSHLSSLIFSTRPYSLDTSRARPLESQALVSGFAEVFLCRYPLFYRISQTF